MKSYFMKAATGLLFTAAALAVWCLAAEVSVVHQYTQQREAQAAEPSKAVVLDTSFVTSEVCVLVVHRSRMVNRTPVARCATAAELKDLVR